MVGYKEAQRLDKRNCVYLHYVYFPKLNKILPNLMVIGLLSKKKVGGLLKVCIYICASRKVNESYYRTNCSKIVR
jgi:hypothetical protein